MKENKSYSMEPFTPEPNPVVYQGSTPIVDEVELDKLFDEIEKDFGWLQLIKMACETNGFGILNIKFFCWLLDFCF